MKLVVCNGRTLEIRDISPVVYALKAVTVPLKPCGWFILEDDVARERIRELRDSGLYERCF